MHNRASKFVCLNFWSTSFHVSCEVLWIGFTTLLFFEGMKKCHYEYVLNIGLVGYQKLHKAWLKSYYRKNLCFFLQDLSRLWLHFIMLWIYWQDSESIGKIFSWTIFQKLNSFCSVSRTPQLLCKCVCVLMQQIFAMHAIDFSFLKFLIKK